MDSTTCPKCLVSFSRKDVMLRHYRNKHGTTQPYPQSTDAYPPPPPPQEEVIPPPPPQEGNISPPPPPPPQEEENISPPLVPEEQSIYTPEKTEQFVFKHPFTMTASGPTACGKTYFVKTMLQNINKMCKPTPERIICLAKVMIDCLSTGLLNKTK